jgi:hypothetical protein
MDEEEMNRTARRLRTGAAVLLLVAAGCAQPASAGPAMTVYLTPKCGCCKHWVTHMRESGFAVTEVVRADLAPVRRELGVPGNLLSCHTAAVDGYAVEGHVPADAVARLLRERPAGRGIAVPGMPMGSPGMEQRGYAPEPYDVVLIGDGGRHTVFERRSGSAR